MKDSRPQTKGAYAFLTTAIFLLLLTAALFYLLTHPESWLTEETTTTTMPTTTTSTHYTTTTTIRTATIFEYAANETNGTLEWLEKRVFDLVNYERANRGLLPLKWNEEIAEVCKQHSKDMVDNDFFSHTGSDGSNSTDRLLRDEVYYWNLTGENIAKVSLIDVYILNIHGEVIEVKYKTFDELAEEAVDGWMNSPHHRQNILRAVFDEAGMGVSTFNESYYFTENFIRRVDCGYKGASCCKTEGYFPWCYRPWECFNMVCR